MSESLEFRQLKETECRVLFMRHAAHEGNILKDGQSDLLIAQAKQLKAAGIEIAGCVSSPADRCLATAYFTKAGFGSGGYTTTDPDLGDLAQEDPELVQSIKSGAAETGSNIETYLFTMAERNHEVAAMLLRRGNEGAAVLRNHTIPGKTILAVSHSGSRMEVTIDSLRHPNSCGRPLQPAHFMEPGQIVELILNESGKTVEERYLATHKAQ